MGRNWSTKRGDTLADDLDILLGDLCVIWGFCNRLTGEHLIAESSILTGDIFAAAILTAEGMNPDYEPGWRRKLNKRFVDRFGALTVSNQTYTN